MKQLDEAGSTANWQAALAATAAAAAATYCLWWLRACMLFERLCNALQKSLGSCYAQAHLHRSGLLKAALGERPQQAGIQPRFLERHYSRLSNAAASFAPQLWQDMQQMRSARLL